MYRCAFEKREMKSKFFNTGFPKVTFAFTLIIAIVAANVLINYYFIKKNKEAISNLTEVVNPFIETLEEFNLVVTESKMYATNWVYLQYSVEDKKNFHLLMNNRYPKLKSKITTLLDKLQKQADKDSIVQIFNKFDELIGVERKVMKTLILFDDYENPQKKFMCEEIIESEVLPRTQNIMQSLNKVIARNRAEAALLKAETESALFRMLSIMLAVSVALFFIIITSVSFISGAIRKPVLRMKEVVQQLAKGELPKETLIARDKNVVSEMVQSVNLLSESFTKTSVFANEIGKGNLSVPYQKLSDNDVLGNALINMRDSLFAYSSEMENKVKERTLEVIEKNAKLEHAYREIRDSITYAKRIQQSILPAEKVMTQVFNENFVFFRPKDIVCGDFYWFAQKGDEVIFAAADCTGHGVPGALMTVIGNSLLNHILTTATTTDPANILTLLDKKLHETFQQHTNAVTNDGMDIAICRYRANKREITFAGAKRPLYMFKNGELIELKGNKSPIGSYSHNYDKQFTSHKIIMNAGDSIYLFSDGIQDQFGGPDGRKFMIKRFRELLEEIYTWPMKKQLERITKEIDNWQGDVEQTDDMLCMAVRF